VATTQLVREQGGQAVFIKTNGSQPTEVAALDFAFNSAGMEDALHVDSL
jgi:hypothetical protein